MLIGISLMVMVVLTLFSIIVGGNFIGSTENVAIDNTALVNGSTTTYVVAGQDVLFQIDTATLQNSAIALIVTIILIASITGIQVLGSGLNSESVRIIILATAFTGIWTVLSLLAFSLIITIEVFGTVIYIALTLAYAIGVITRLTGGGSD